MAKLRVFDIYKLWYGNFHVDPKPMLYVLWSDGTDTFGLNLDYLPRVFSPKWKYRMISLEAATEMLEKFRNHPAMKVFFATIESPPFDMMNFQSKVKVLQSRWPKFMTRMFRHYKSRYIRVITHMPKLQVESFIDKYSVRNEQPENRD